MKIGDYVRTNNGLIFKIVGGNEDNWELDIEYLKLEFLEDTWLELYRYNDNGGWFIRENCKHSQNIIDLIEVGDYVNGLKVDKKYEDRVVINTRDEIIVWFDYQIKSIVTKEQFESVEYRL